MFVSMFLSLFANSFVNLATNIFANKEITNEIKNFFETIFLNNDNNLSLFALFDSWQALILSLIDISVSTLFIYFVLKLFKQSRAWQLFKGAIFIFAFTIVSSFLGLTTISYLLTNSISILLIGFVVIFQPELRKALETLGRKSFNIIINATENAGRDNSQAEIKEIINELVLACERMAKLKTGALIVIERTTGLREIIDNSSTAVIIDGKLTSAALEQIFYKNSPLHDGALIIRNMRIYAARCHVPLSETTLLNAELGTRHRAALGVTEIGDAIAIVVSEERGTISVASNGKMLHIKTGVDLQNLLEAMLYNKDLGFNDKFLRLKQKLSLNLAILSSIYRGESIEDKIENKKEKTSFRDSFRNVSLQFFSFCLAVFLYLFVQIRTNPVETEVFNQFNISKVNSLKYEKAGYQINLENIKPQVTIKARRNIIEKLSANFENLVAYVELPPELVEGTFTLPIKYNSNVVEPRFFKIQSQHPLNLIVNIQKIKHDDFEFMPGVKENLKSFVNEKGNKVAN